MFGRMMVSALALMGVAHAQEAPPPAGAPDNAAPQTNEADRTAYPASFFARYTPQTALDMVRQTPGFSLNGGDEERRGFSGAVGNLLIDGTRPTAKSQSVETILGQIPATQVVRIEVLRGAAVAGDASGQATLVNVVRTPNAGSGVWNAGGEVNQGRLAPQVDASYSGRTGATEYGVGASYYSERRSLPGWRRLYDANSVQTGFVDTPSRRAYQEMKVNGNFARPIAGGRFSATSQFDAWRFANNGGLDFFDPAQTTLNEDFDTKFAEHQWSVEVGLNYDRDFGPWSTEIVGLLTRRYYDNNEDDMDNDILGGSNSIITLAQHRDSGETILRGTASRNFGAAHHVEIGIEGAKNTLDNVFSFIHDDGAGPITENVPNANVTVEEKRYEPFIDYTWRPNNRWSVEGRLARESSTLTFSGDANQSVELAYIKPSIQVSRNVGAHNQLHLRAYRDVGQLNFDDFVSASSVADNLINGGNPDLKPQTSYRLEFGGDLHLPAGITVTFAYTHGWITDAADVVELSAPGANPGDPPILFDAPGNIGDATEDLFSTSSTIPFGRFLPGGKLTITTNYEFTEVTDPVTGRRRQASGQSDFCTNGELRQDISAKHLSWGFNFDRCVENQTFRFNEIDVQEEGPYVDFFVESTAIPHLKLRATIANTLNPSVRRQRLFYGDLVTPDRNGPLNRFESRDRHFDDAPWVVLQASGTF